MTTWGPGFDPLVADRQGFIVARTNRVTEYTHVLGGSRVPIVDVNGRVFGGPTLLITLDLSDPKMSALKSLPVQVLPLASYINCNVWESRQKFRIDPVTMSLSLVERRVDSIESLPPQDMLPNPLPEVRLILKPMRQKDNPADEQAYYDAFDNFTGGDASFRVLGLPLWNEDLSEFCECGSQMKYIASIGYEVGSARYFKGVEFFFGEGCLYYFLCFDCLRYNAVSQGT
jgi:hypothetical protein